jgi:hypothetical protein
MDKKRVQIIITSILVLVLIFAWANAINAIRKKSKSKNAIQAQAAPSFTPNNPQPIASGAENKKKEVREDDNAGWKRCPFSGISCSDESSTEDLRISGIIWDEAAPKVIINGQILGEGDFIGGLRVENIEKHKVTLSDNQKIIELNI